jgi:hypothetical protein
MMKERLLRTDTELIILLLPCGVNLSVSDMTRGRIEQPFYRLPGRCDLLKAYAD